MPGLSTHNVRGSLQRVAQDRGQVLPRVVRGDRRHPAAGWYWRPTQPLDGCTCLHCAAAKAGQDAYLGDHGYLAAGALETYIEAHP